MINQLISDNFKRSFAEFISTIAYAPLISIPAFALINYFLLDLYNFVIITTVCAIFAGILPILLVLFLLKNRSNGKEIDMDIPERADRHYPLLLVILTYIIGTIVLYTLNAPAITTVLMFCYFSNTLILFFINLYWKISIHAMGVAGPSVALIYVFGLPGLIFSLIIPLVMWSRLYLKKHTFFQVIIGALLGVILTALQIHYLI
ncbi:phosphatase PAP2 family protein [Methanobacterium oryzae]|uniref:phosphatase PAP2 family protein n=1 Tax=Methanobacterium oryzae TaxID=69540 RepID=UPI003D195551